jgi:6-phosphogluconolactonase (cycloisomerase 2 family)
MKPFTRLVATVPLVVAVVAAFAVPAVAAPRSRNRTGSTLEASHRDADHAVFVQTDDPAGNKIVAYHRASDGSLTEAGTYATGGKGGVLAGSVVDHLASQASLTYDAEHQLLLAVNAGSNTLTVFAVRGDRLAIRQVVRSGGRFPVSVAVHGNVAYVLNARAGASLQGFRIVRDNLVAISRSHRKLGLDPTATPEFVNTPGQVAFSPDGSQLIVTTKANGNDVDVFRVRFDGRLSAAAVVNAEPGTVPFAVTFDPARHLVVSEAGTNSVATFDLHGDGTIAPLDAVATGQSATCWIATINGQFYASNAGSASVSRFQSGAHGTLSLLDQTSTDAGTVDAAASADGQSLYVQTGANGIVDEYHVNTDGSLTQIGSVTVANAVGGEGIVAV